MRRRKEPCSLQTYLLVLLLFWAIIRLVTFSCGSLCSISVVSVLASFVVSIKTDFQLERSHLERGTSPEQIKINCSSDVSFGPSLIKRQANIGNLDGLQETNMFTVWEDSWDRESINHDNVNRGFVLYVTVLYSSLSIRSALLNLNLPWEIKFSTNQN